MHRLSGAAAGEQPPRAGVGGGLHVVPFVNPGEQELRERVREGHAPEQETAQASAEVLIVFGVPCVNVGLLAGS